MISGLSNNPSNIQLFSRSKSSKNIAFGAGWTAQIQKQVNDCDIDEIVERLAKKGIESNFKDNKVIAWCCNKTVEIFEELNKKYKLKLALPKGIFVEDFSKLDIDDQDMYGLCNWFSSEIIKDSSKVFPEKTVFFNSFDKKLSIVPEDEKDCLAM